MRRLFLLVAGLVLLAGVAATVSGGGTQTQPRWVITDLGTLGGQDSWPSAISERGEVVGVSEKALFEDVYRGFLWRHGRMTDLGSLGGQDTDVVAFNERGQVIGWSDTGVKDRHGNPISHAFIWQGGKMTDLGTLPGTTWSRALAINERGQVVGRSKRYWREPYREHPGVQREVRAFLWEKNRMIDLGTLPGGRKAEALAINDLGQVVGWSGDGRSPHAFLWDKGEMTDLGVLPGMSSSIAVAISNRGDIIGQSYGSSRSMHAVVWRDGKIHDLGALGGKSSKPSAINERGEIVGWSTTANRQWRAFLWHGGKMVSVGPLGPSWCFMRLAEGLVINDEGVIVGSGVTKGPLVLRSEGGHDYAFVWQKGRLTKLPGREANAYDVNIQSQIVGNVETSLGPVDHAVLWTLKRG